MTEELRDKNVIFYDFGSVEPITQSHSTESVAVATWTSEDFAKMYVRYRPRLESYARKWLKDPTEVDEVIQDAFMYLFLSQPELDSEIGVLKFLQWKTRLLCLDVLKAQGRRPIAVLDAEENFDLNRESTDSAETEYENMFDAAIVHAALARIPERQREILIRSEFQEQSASEISAAMGVTENATRQLLHRARKSFRDALVSEINIAGIEVSAVLSVAVRKAKEISKNAGAMIVILLVPALVALGTQLMPNVDKSNSVVFAYPDTRSELPVLPETPATQQPSVNDDSIVDSKSVTENATPTALKKNRVIGRVTAHSEWSPTVTLSNFPLNASGLALDFTKNNEVVVHLESVDGLKLMTSIRLVDGQYSFDFSYLIDEKNAVWRKLEVSRLERNVNAKGDLILNAIIRDSSGEAPVYFGTSFTLQNSDLSVSNARIVGLAHS